jgi:hypothetical protein
MEGLLRGSWSFRRIKHLITQLKVILFDAALLILFVAMLIKVVRAELGW